MNLMMNVSNNKLRLGSDAEAHSPVSELHREFGRLIRYVKIMYPQKFVMLEVLAMSKLLS